MVRYIDTGSRDPNQALGTWLGDELLDGEKIAELRVQTGFFGARALGYFESALETLAASDGHTCLLIGSNDGLTPRAAIQDLLAVAGLPRPNLRIGVLSFLTGFFHPKVFHIVRTDGSIAAYVGSANLTPAGVSAQHVEAGIILDSRDGDSGSVLVSIAKTVDDWFKETRGGLYPVAGSTDLDALVAAGVLDVPTPPRPRRTIKPAAGGASDVRLGRPLIPLVAIPELQTPLETKSPAVQVAADTGTTEPEGAMSSPPTPPSVSSVAHWSKTLSPSDAQRRAGHQSKLIALTQGHYRRRIDHTSYFRDELFGSETWKYETTTSREPLEVAYVPMRTTIDGTDHGTLTFRITHAIHRESGTNSPTTEVHLEPIASLFVKSDMTNKEVEIERYEDGSYTFTIT
jgi:hypothetical protein